MLLVGSGAKDASLMDTMAAVLDAAQKSHTASYVNDVSMYIPRCSSRFLFQYILNANCDFFSCVTV